MDITRIIFAILLINLALIAVMLVMNTGESKVDEL